MWVSAAVTVLGAVIAAVAITARAETACAGCVEVAEAEASPGGEELAGGGRRPT